MESSYKNMSLIGDDTFFVGHSKSVYVVENKGHE